MLALADDLRLGLDPVAFAVEALNFEPDDWQIAVLRSPLKRMLLNCHRQSGKSTIASILALHRALYFPSSLILLVSPSLRQSSELFHKVGEQFAKLEQQPELTEDNKLSCTLANRSRIVSLPSSEATIRGFSGAALIIEDESARVPDALYKAVRPMLAVSGGRLILMSTPIGKRGHFFEEWANGPASWGRTMIKATDCPRISPEFLAEERASLGDFWYRQEYECEFAEVVDQVFGYETVMGAMTSDVKPLFGGV